MTNDLERRLEALQRRLNADRPAGTTAGGALLCVEISGCLPTPDGLPLWANAGEHEWIRSDGEDLDLFADRCVAAALEAGQRLLVIGGFPISQAGHDRAQAAHAEWLASDSGVPPEEESRGLPSPVERAIADRDRLH